jgi:hypothetical protein
MPHVDPVSASVELLGIISGLNLSKAFLALGDGGLLSDDCNPAVRNTRRDD